MKNSVILKVTNDKYELIVDLYDTTKDMAKALNISLKSARSLIYYSKRNNIKKKVKYVRVWLNKDYEEENDKEFNR